MFAKRNGLSWFKRILFTLAGNKFDSAARKQGKEYRFMFVRSDGKQLKRVTEIVENTISCLILIQENSLCFKSMKLLC